MVLHVSYELLRLYDTLQSNSLVKTNTKQTRNHEEHLPQEEVERGVITVARGATTYPPW